MRILMPYLIVRLRYLKWCSNKNINESFNINSISQEMINLTETIADKWLIQNWNNFRFNAFIIIINLNTSPILKDLIL